MHVAILLSSLQLPSYHTHPLPPTLRPIPSLAMKLTLEFQPFAS